MTKGAMFIYHGKAQLDMSEAEIYVVRKKDFKKVYLGLCSNDGEDFGLADLILSEELLNSMLDNKNELGSIEIIE